MKRFTETNKWSDPWFRKLTPEEKLAFIYICENCDNAGVWAADKELAEWVIGMPIQWDSILTTFQSRVQVLDNGSWLVLKFIEFQFGTLSQDCRAHQSVIRLVEKHKIQGVLNGYEYPLDTLKDKDKDKDIGDARGKKPERPTVEQAQEYAVEIGMAEIEGQKFVDHFTSNGWKVGGSATMKNWQAAMRNWKRRIVERDSTNKPKRNDLAGIEILN